MDQKPPRMAPPRTVHEAIEGLVAQGRPALAELIRRANERETFALLVDRLPHAIEAGCADQTIALLKFWGAWHDLYPVDKAVQALLAHRGAGVESDERSTW
jgi:hypothetical protein